MLSPHGDSINAQLNFVIYNAPDKLHEEVQRLRAVLQQKEAQYPSSLPDRTNQGLPSELGPSVGEKLVPSHLRENTSSGLDLD
jgi:hypothetical protein